MPAVALTVMHRQSGLPTLPRCLHGPQPHTSVRHIMRWLAGAVMGIPSATCLGLRATLADGLMEGARRTVGSRVYFPSSVY
jgi:hypothetical protein